MKIKNQHVYSSNQEWLAVVADEARSMGRDVELAEGHLVVYALPRKKVKKKETEEEARRNKTKRERWYGKARD